VPLSTDASGRPERTVEVSPLFGVDAESFTQSWRKLSPLPEVTDGLYLE
jgi:UDP-N-acetylglucosamine/UDP-N-acetylgalactosamine diphosphorylase